MSGCPNCGSAPKDPCADRCPSPRTDDIHIGDTFVLLSEPAQAWEVTRYDTLTPARPLFVLQGGELVRYVTAEQLTGRGAKWARCEAMATNERR